jgi:hypothetical protein
MPLLFNTFFYKGSASPRCAGFNNPCASTLTQKFLLTPHNRKLLHRPLPPLNMLLMLLPVFLN